MGVRMNRLLVGAAMLSMTLAGAARAAEYKFSMIDDANVLWASGVLTVNDTPNAHGGYVVTGISGTTATGPIVGLIPDPTPGGFAYYLQDGSITATWTPFFEWGFDNVVYPKGLPYLDEYGLLFESSSLVYGAADDGSFPGQDTLEVSSIGVPGGPYDGTGWGGHFVLTPVPEPATWAMMLVGMGLLGFGLRRRTGVIRYA